MGASPRIVFYGTPQFAVASLDSLRSAGFFIAGVVTATDKPMGRGLRVGISEVKEYATRHQLPLLQPENLKSPEFLESLKGFQPDLQVVVAFRMLPRTVWALPRLGTFNLHASLLPQYRGAAPINRVLMNGEKETGVTTFFINEQIDTGAILLQRKVQIGDHETAGELHDKLMETGARLVVETVKGIMTGSVSPALQAEFIPPGVTLNTAPRLQKEDSQIDWNKRVEEVYNQIRGLTPFPGAYTALKLSDGSLLPVKITGARPDLSALHVLSSPGSVTTDTKRFLTIEAMNGRIWIRSLQPAGRKSMDIRDFLNGYGTQLA